MILTRKRGLKKHLNAAAGARMAAWFAVLSFQVSFVVFNNCNMWPKGYNMCICRARDHLMTTTCIRKVLNGFYFDQMGESKRTYYFGYIVISFDSG
jgi:hypothetical protein